MIVSFYFDENVARLRKGANIKTIEFENEIHVYNLVSFSGYIPENCSGFTFECNGEEYQKLLKTVRNLERKDNPFLELAGLQVRDLTFYSEYNPYINNSYTIK